MSPAWPVAALGLVMELLAGAVIRTPRNGHKDLDKLWSRIGNTRVHFWTEGVRTISPHLNIDSTETAMR